MFPSFLKFNVWFCVQYKYSFNDLVAGIVGLFTKLFSGAVSSWVRVRGLEGMMEE